jgi:hypothetical protein
MDLEAAVLGGAVFGGGGGGSIAAARALGVEALAAGEPRRVSIDEVPDHGLLVTLSLVGAPSRESTVSPADDLVRAAERLIESLKEPPVGFIPSEVGAGGMVVCWPAAIRLGLPVVDAPANGRAHPIAAMGSMGLARDPEFQSRQAVVGRWGDDGFELGLEGRLEWVDRLVRRAAAGGSGLVAVARNAVPASYVRQHGACGAMTRAQRVGEEARSRQAAGGAAVAGAIADALEATVCFEGRLGSREKSSRPDAEGLDAGVLRLEGADGSRARITYWNEFMTLEREGERLFTFPDLILTLDAETGLPLGSTEVAAGTRVLVLGVPRERLLLGSGAKDPALLALVERVVGGPR